MTLSILPLQSSPDAGTPYVAYSYSYPHKTAYRSLDPPIPLSDVWRDENKNALFLYIHIPFCEHRCGFCNLFTEANPETGLTHRYLDQLAIEATAVAQAIDVTSESTSFARLAIGGGTPTFLTAPELEKLFKIVHGMQVDATAVPVSVEVSPATVDATKLKLLKDFGTDRISIGIQSFNDKEAHQIGRPQQQIDVVKSLELIREHDFPVLNIDLIYGGEQQSLSQWLWSVQEAIRWQPEELYLYPLYVRPLTGLGRQQRSWDDHRLEAYREAAALLQSNGYEQVSMRMFRRTNSMLVAGPTYCCQADGMAGLGCGARSYTQKLHYSTEYAVGRKGVKSILADYINRDPASFTAAQHGYRLSIEEQRRRYVIVSLLQDCGMSWIEYRERFDDDLVTLIPEVQTLLDLQLATTDSSRLRLTTAGLERSDAIGPWLYSETVRNQMNETELS